MGVRLGDLRVRVRYILNPGVRVRVRVRVRGGGFTSSESDTECVDTSSYCPCRL